MAIGSAQDRRFGEAWGALQTVVAAEGSAADRWVLALAGDDTAPRDLADAVHCLCLLHGRHPGVIEFAQAKATHPVVEAWLAEAVDAFTTERTALIHLVAAVGPLPSTPGQSESEAAIVGQRHALDMLAASDRIGCPVGAAMALALDWPGIRLVLHSAARRFGQTLPTLALPNQRESATVVASLADSPAFERAMLFGAHQTLAQHQALWRLLEARAGARAAL